MRSFKSPVSAWVRNAAVLAPVSAIPGMVIAACLNAPLSVGVATVIAYVAVNSTKLAFGEKDRKCNK